MHGLWGYHQTLVRESHHSGMSNAVAGVIDAMALGAGLLLIINDWATVRTCDYILVDGVES